MDIKKLDEMIMRLFSLKGKIGYTEFDIVSWREELKHFNINDIANSFSKCIKKEGWFEIKQILDELQPNNKNIAISEWDKIMRVAMDGGQDFEKLSDSTKKSLRLAGGLQKLRVCESDYTRDQMRKTFIDTFDIDCKEIGYDQNTKTYDFVKSLSDTIGNKKQIGSNNG